jgi:hypothetical protein
MNGLFVSLNTNPKSSNLLCISPVLTPKKFFSQGVDALFFLFHSCERVIQLRAAAFQFTIGLPLP